MLRQILIGKKGGENGSASKMQARGKSIRDKFYILKYIDIKNTEKETRKGERMIILENDCFCFYISQQRSVVFAKYTKLMSYIFLIHYKNFEYNSMLIMRLS